MMMTDIQQNSMVSAVFACAASSSERSAQPHVSGSTVSILSAKLHT